MNSKFLRLQFRGFLRIGICIDDREECLLLGFKVRGGPNLLQKESENTSVRTPPLKL